MRKTESAEAPAPTRLGPSPEQLAAHRISPRFYNADLAPSRKEGRSWTAYSVFTLWANDVHSLGNYGFALGLFALGLGAWQILLALLVGAALPFFLITLSGFMGYKTGVPYPVMSRISFGIHGAQWPPRCGASSPSPGSASRPTWPRASSTSCC
ncbi:Permease for cytosine/purines, uracil, thiamine, allantoin [Brevibacterium iodinum ATCC 49514]|uniref:Permease for cytosine/purines, uracil, thiamine, allantoin n=1 Tax=Brevibacterium iodinum ATCC 49514 TaxID=1255616 RepID=A0A2H1IMA4_9MICO|nr:Permease for cytosine/purines, uracil, thiamine, allantoin [Brevibacterium iodinum ATCC 49514]SUW11915.1 Allantoin transport protein [Brevibacterium iodinum]